MTIQSEVESINAQLKMLHIELERLQESCIHPWECRSFTAGYISSSDTYWRENFCTICEKRWRETSK